jgi:clan AA aspartic protease
MELEPGKVNSYREALVQVRFREGAEIECVVDTGFNGALMLPRGLVSQIPIPIVGELTFGMVGGATMSAEIGLTHIRWFDEVREVEVIVSEGDDALVGTELLTATTLVINYSLGIVAIYRGEVLAT